MKNSSESPLSLLRRMSRAWNNFWFSPGDPTLLALIRICCGAITVYTLLAYSFTLQDLFGKDAWVSLAFRDDIRRHTPVLIPPTGWEPGAGIPEPTCTNDHQRDYVKAYKETYGTYPPLPFPKDMQDSQAIEDYHDRFGIDPRLVQLKGDPEWSLWYHLTDPTAMAIAHGYICVIAFLFTIGLCTRLTAALTWAASLCYINRSPPTLFGADTMMTILLLYLMIGPSGAALSVDRLVLRWWERVRPRFLARWRAFWQRGTSEPLPPAALLGPPQPSVSANFALRLLQVHVCIIYLAAGLSKLQGNSWWSGNAVWLTVANFEFAPMQHDSYVDALRLLTTNRPLWEVFMTTAGAFTLFFEIGYVFLIWRPSTRWLMLTMAVILHGFIGLFMGLKTFSLIMLVMNMAFLSPRTVNLFLRPFHRGKLFNGPHWPAGMPLEPELAGVGASSKRKK
jgi:hypothetical protein